MESSRLFHIVLDEDWQAFRENAPDALAPPSLATEGFVHLSFAHQLAGSLEAHFSGPGPVWLVEVELGNARALVVEPSRGGALFPHLRRPIERAEFSRCWRIERTGEGWKLPELADNAELDRPAGTAPPE